MVHKAFCKHKKIHKRNILYSGRLMRASTNNYEQHNTQKISSNEINFNLGFLVAFSLCLCLCLCRGNIAYTINPYSDDWFICCRNEAQPATARSLWKRTKVLRSTKQLDWTDSGYSNNSRNGLIVTIYSWQQDRLKTKCVCLGSTNTDMDT